MSAMSHIAEARASALSLRASAKACMPDQGALKFRLMRAAESLDAMVLIAVRALERIKQLEQQLTVMSAGSGEPAERAVSDSQSALASSIAADAPILVGSVDVAPLALAARILRMVADEVDEGASELHASVQAARRIVWEVFRDLEAASARGAQ